MRRASLLEKALHALVGRARRFRGENGERALSIGGFGPVEDEDPAVWIAERVRHAEENEVAAIVDHEVKRSSRSHYRGWLMLPAVREHADICPSNVRAQTGVRNRIVGRT